VRWPVDQLLQHLGVNAALLTAGDEYNDPPLASRLRSWASEVEAFIEVPLDSSTSEMIALEDYRASLLNRGDIGDMVEELPADVREAVERWLGEGPDAEFLSLTEPDDDHLLIRADIDDAPEGKLWDSRVPQRGLARIALERRASKNDALPGSGITGRPA
jgi:hypothetical protein